MSLYRLPVVLFIATLVLSFAACSSGEKRDLTAQHAAAVAKSSIEIRPTPTLESHVRHWIKGNEYLGNGQFQLAIDEFDEVIPLGADFRGLYTNRGSAYAGLGEHRRAIEDYDEAVRLRPNAVEVYFNRGNSYLHLGEYRTALKDYDKAIELDPEFPGSYRNRGITFTKLGQDSLAERDRVKACELDRSRC
tara:strand:+ start:516 stop:1088 length:573 start_codon:yes stop_codon:yes gene_type:complete